MTEETKKNFYTEKTEIDFFGKSVEVGFPNIGEFWKIEERKQMLTNGRYAIIALTSLQTADIALDIINAIAYGTVMIPEFCEAFGKKNFMELQEVSFDKSLEMVDVYRNHLKPIIDPVLEEVTARLFPDKKGDLSGK